MDGFANNFTLAAHLCALLVKPVDYSMASLSTIIQASAVFFAFSF
jgi:hypothetical protein